MPVVAAAAQIANEEWDFFGKQEIDINGKTIRRGRKETDEGFWQRVGQYWMDGTGKNLTGENDDFPWSAAFISFVMRKAGAGDRFRYSAQHSVYIRHAVKARERGDEKYGFWGYALADSPIKVGDLVCYARQPGISVSTQSSNYKSHVDLVVEVTLGKALVIGGNVGNSVTRKAIELNSTGHLIDNTQPWFAVLSHRFDNA
ncbi:DUF2272 domain-containing protein [uncultured Aquimonas sp.]|uniref:DUF2272 domain-containing protein n=1 Tax=uncultured Aquimonas sp. TaxID=385483 RepID=UPI002634907A|nr:DUF2272 domain-containing protein [uncultured Aquimonas sp.]